MGTLIVAVSGEAAITEFCKRYATARKPLARFLGIARIAAWFSSVEVKQSYPSVDYAAATGVLIFDIGGNKYRLIARVDFEEQMVYIESVMTHEQYNRENL